MAEYLVSNTSELVAQIKAASAGDTILLAPGTYDPAIVRKTGELGITIASQDTDNPAILTGFVLTDASDVRFSDVVFRADAGDNNAFEFNRTSNLTFSGIVVHGPDNVGTGNEVSPLMIRDSADVTIIGSEFFNVYHGVKLLDVDGIVISGNEFHDIRCDGIRGGGVSNALVTGNSFTDFYPIGNDHPDAIQFWSTNQDTPGRNLVISDNVVVRGDGAPIQGIFIRDTFDKMPFENVTITGNVVLGGLYNGISVDGVVGGELTGNLVIGYPDQRSWVRVNVDTHFDVSGNEATAYSLDDNSHRLANLEISENVDFYSSIVHSWSAGDGDLSDLIGALRSAAVYDDVQGVNVAAQLNATISGISGTWQDDEIHASGKGGKVNGEAGDDILIGDIGADLFVGNIGDDILYGNGNADILCGGDGNDILRGGLASDRLFGGRGDDELIGGSGNDKLFGGGAQDYLVGGEGADRLFGGGGIDTLFGGAGNDFIFGGYNDDILIGGLGSDKFIFRGHDGVDTILDFTRGEDRISLWGVDADESTAANDPFQFIGQKAFSGNAGELRFEKVGNGVMVFGDTDGNGVADFQLMVEGTDNLTMLDFIL